jgi:hypothetical protein
MAVKGSKTNHKNRSRGGDKDKTIMSGDSHRPANMIPKVGTLSETTKGEDFITLGNVGRLKMEKVPCNVNVNKGPLNQKGSKRKVQQPTRKSTDTKKSKLRDFLSSLND